VSLVRCQILCLPLPVLFRTLYLLEDFSVACSIAYLAELLFLQFFQSPVWHAFHLAVEAGVDVYADIARYRFLRESVVLSVSVVLQRMCFVFLLVGLLVVILAFEKKVVAVAGVFCRYFLLARLLGQEVGAEWGEFHPVRMELEAT